MKPTHSSQSDLAHPKVALVFETPNAYARGLLLGISAYHLSRGPWRIHLALLNFNDPPPLWLSRWEGDGIIARCESRSLARFLGKLTVPVIDLTPSRLLPCAPWVKSDDSAIAALAFQHFKERGFQNFAFCGEPGLLWSEKRGDAFSLLAKDAGCFCDRFRDTKTTAKGDAKIDKMALWLRKLPKPLAVFAAYDQLGQQVLDACHRAQLSVPEEVAVLGVDNDEVLCSLSPPPLSSVILNPHTTGWRAAALLDKLIKREPVPEHETLVSPLGIATRQSTDVLAIDDPNISKALRFIRENAHRQIGVLDVQKHCGISRRSLELRFQKLLGRSPRQEITRAQVNVVKELLAGTQLTLNEIASKTGFEHAEYLSVVFKRETGMTATAFRRKHGFGEG